MKMKLFDQNLIKNLPKYEKYSDPGLVWLLIAHGKVVNKHRNELRRWFQNIPIKHKRDIKSRLESLDYKQHIAAIYELVWHQYFLEEGWKPEIHPDLMNTLHKPDFLVKTNKNKNIYFE